MAKRGDGLLTVSFLEDSGRVVRMKTRVVDFEVDLTEEPKRGLEPVEAYLEVTGVVTDPEKVEWEVEDLS